MKKYRQTKAPCHDAMQNECPVSLTKCQLGEKTDK